jgi:hypothetical protein
MLLKRRFYAPFNSEPGAGSSAPAAVPAAPAAPAPGAPPAPAPAPQQERTSFSLEYVQELRAENAKYRTNAKDAKDAAEAADKRAKDAEAAAEAKAKAANDAANARIIRAELKAVAIKAGMVDLDGLKLADLASVKLDDKGEVVGAEELMAALKTAKPYLFQQAPTSTTQTQQTPPKKEDPKPFDARTATDEERAAKARELGISVKKR